MNNKYVTYLPQWTLEQVKQTQGLLLDLHTNKRKIQHSIWIVLFPIVPQSLLVSWDYKSLGLAGVLRNHTLGVSLHRQWLPKTGSEGKG